MFKMILLRGLLPLMVVACGVGGAVYLKKQSTSAKHRKPQELVTTVELITATPKEMAVRLQVTGSVRAARQVTLTPEVSGRVVKLSKNLIPGSHFKKGQLIARIDPKDYLLALNQLAGQVEQAELNLRVEKGRGAVAEEEWKMIVGDLGEGESVSQLALRKPHLEVAEQQAKSVKSGLEKARLNLKRTTLRAPFNAMVIDKKVDVGQLVGPTTPVATLMGTDELWVNVSVPVAQLTAIDIPGINADKGSPAEVSQRIGPNRTIVRQGEVIRLQGQLDSQNRTANLLVSIKNPFDSESAGLPLLAGAYVEVSIEGRALSGVFEIPREALREDAYVWLASKDDKLKKAEVTVGWSERDSVIITHGLTAGDRIVTSPISFPIEGMTVRAAGKPDARKKAPAASGDTGASDKKESAKP